MSVSNSTPAPPLRFIPCIHGWAALHPHPQGVVQFVGTSRWGGWPALAYRHFLQQLYAAGYTVVVLLLPTSRCGWFTALELFQEQYEQRVALVEAALKRGYDPAVYLQEQCYAWVGHGVGCRPVVMLEILKDALTERCHQELKAVVTEPVRYRLVQRLRALERRIYELTAISVSYTRPRRVDTAAVLLAPVMGDLEIPLPWRRLVRRLQSAPAAEQIHQLVAASPRFSRTAVVQFDRDRTAAPTCQQLMWEQPRLRRRLLAGAHLAPVGLRWGNVVVDFNPFDKFIQPLSCRTLESQTLTLLTQLMTGTAKQRRATPGDKTASLISWRGAA